MLTKDNPDEGLRIDSLLKMVNEKLLFTEKIIAMRRNNEFIKDGKIEFPKTGKYIADRIREQIGHINSDEIRLLEQ